MERWQESYDRMLAAGPPEPPTADLTVKWEAHVLGDRLPEVTGALGGEASWAATPETDGTCLAKGSTLVEEAESYEGAEDVVLQLFYRHLAEIVDTENLIIEAERLEADEPDWDAIEKDRRIEEGR